MTMAKLDAPSAAMHRGLRAAPWAGAGAITGAFAYLDGGYFPGAVAPIATMLLLLIACAALAARHPMHGWGITVAVAAVPFAAFAAWTYASSGWSGSPGRAATEASRVILYLATFGLFAAAGWSAARARGLAAGLLAAITVICLLGVGSRLMPGLVDGDPGPEPERLSFPVTYWNALGLLAAFGVILGVHLSSSLQERWWARCAGAAVVPLIASALLLTLSRSGLWSCALGLVVYILIAHPRGLPTAAIAIVPTTFVAVLGVDHSAALGVPPEAVARYDLGGQPAWLIGGAMLAAALGRAACLPLDRRIAGVVIRPTARRVLVGGGAAAIAVSVALGVIVLRDSGLGGQAYDRFTAGLAPERQTAADRITSLSNNNRLSKWEAALDEYRADPTHGSGAGTFELVWIQRRGTDGQVREAHSLYLEVLGELGWPGLVLLVAALGAMLLGLARRARGPARAAPAALLAGMIAWAASAAVDWDWEMPVVTVWVFAACGLALARDSERAPVAAGRRRLATRVVVAAACVLTALVPAQLTLSELRLQDSLAAARRGDCPTAEAAARASLSVQSGRWEPRQVIGYCEITQGRFADAQRTLAAAVERDPRNWLPRYTLAVAQAGAGADPRPALAAAARYNPRQRLVSADASHLIQASPRAARRAAARALVPLP
jgi:hypothetical protein